MHALDIKLVAVFVESRRVHRNKQTFPATLVGYDVEAEPVGAGARCSDGGMVVGGFHLACDVYSGHKSVGVHFPLPHVLVVHVHEVTVFDHEAVPLHDVFLDGYISQVLFRGVTGGALNLVKVPRILPNRVEYIDLGVSRAVDEARLENGDALFNKDFCRRNMRVANSPTSWPCANRPSVALLKGGNISLFL